MTYKEFLKTKELQTIQSGFDVDKDTLNKNLFQFQRDIVAWALKKGRCAVLIGCGLGKSIIQLEWANQIYKKTQKNVLIVAPLAVVKQTAREAEKFSIETPIHICRSQGDVKEGINITNYEMVEHFDENSFVAVVLDESSILKSFTSKTTVEFTRKFAKLPYKLLCTATIAPNDVSEIATSCEFLGIMSRTEMLATYFIHDGGKTSEWRLKKSGVKRFWEWFATWAICFNNPNELGYEIEGYNLPALNIHTIITESKLNDYEFVVRVAETLQERREARKESMEDRTDKAKEIAESEDSQCLIWVDYNDESTMIHKKIADSVEVKGSDESEYKANASVDFADGNIRYLISKPSIFGFGSNFQSCHRQIFCGLSDSYERFYQAIRRCWRFGQDHDVDCYIILSERELSILENIKRKQALMDEMQRQMTALMREVIISEIKNTTRITTEYNRNDKITLPTWINRGA